MPKSLFIELKFLKIPVSGLMDEIPFVLVFSFSFWKLRTPQINWQLFGLQIWIIFAPWCINRNSWEKRGMNGLSPDLLEFCLLIANYWPSSLFWLQRWLMHHLSLEDPAVMICHLCWFRIMAIWVVEFSNGSTKLEIF